MPQTFRQLFLHRLVKPQNIRILKHQYFSDKEMMKLNHFIKDTYWVCCSRGRMMLQPNRKTTYFFAPLFAASMTLQPTTCHYRVNPNLRQL